MEALSRRDFRAALDFLATLGEASDLDDYAARVTIGLESIISCRAAYNEVNVLRRRVRWITSVPTGPADIAAFEHHIPQNPFITFLSAHPDHDAVANTDLLSGPRWRDLGVYHDLYRPHRLEHILAVNASEMPMMIGIALFRDQTPFNTRDRAMLSMLRPHLANSYRKTAILSDLGERTTLLDRGLEIGGLAAIVLDSDDGVVWTSASARRWVADYFGESRSDVLPDAVLAWLRRASLPPSSAEAMPAEVPLIVDRDDARLHLRIIRQGSRRFILMQEQRRMIRPEQLRSLGLARRESEILAWVAAGKTDGEIASILAISPRTVSHTLERVYRKLGVETRTAAAARALGAVHDPGAAAQ